jgi:hypothetical protein
MAEPVGLSAAEACVLMTLPRFNARLALKFGLMGLLAQGILRSDEETRPGLVRTRRILHLRVAPDLPADLPPLAASLVAVVNAAAPREGVIDEVIKQAMRAYRRTLVGFVLDGIGPALVARGFAEMRHRRLLGIFPNTAFHCTPTGEAEKTRVQNALHEARAIPQYLDRDPAQAATLAAAAGGAILLVEELRTHYPQLAKAFEEPDASSSPFPVLVDYGQPGTFHFGCIDFATVDLGCFDSFDSGFDGASDGGGSDGGNSGC